jgi:hypothetical protein
MLNFLLPATFPECRIRFHRNEGNSAAAYYSLPSLHYNFELGLFDLFACLLVEDASWVLVRDFEGFRWGFPNLRRMKNLRVLVKFLWNNPRMRSPVFHLPVNVRGIYFLGGGGDLVCIYIFLKCLGNLFAPTPMFLSLGEWVLLNCVYCWGFDHLRNNKRAHISVYSKNIMNALHFLEFERALLSVSSCNGARKSSTRSPASEFVISRAFLSMYDNELLKC